MGGKVAGKQFDSVFIGSFDNYVFSAYFILFYLFIFC